MPEKRLLRGSMLNVINPATEEIVADFNLNSDAEIKQILSDVSSGFTTWSKKSISERAKPMKKMARILSEEPDKYGRLITKEMGKPIIEAREEVKKCAAACNFFADHAEDLLKEETISDDKQTGTISYEPLGIILGIMPWNFPFWQVFRFIAPTLMAGNGIIIKHALNVPGCAYAIEEIAGEAGFPHNLVRSIFVADSDVASLIKNPIVRGVSLTGSDRAGELVGAGAGSFLKKCVLELGGSDPYIVLEDADMSSCIETAIKARLLNSGQSCIAAKRFIIVRSKMDEFCEGLLNGLKKIKIGDPMQEETTMGPLARKDLLDKLDQQVHRSIDKGAILLLGGKPLDQSGFYYPPTVLINVSKGMPAFDEETFGPLFAIIEAKDADHTIELANDSVYGLGSSLWTQDEAKANDMARKLQTGVVFINSMTVSDPRFPFGGIKRSGFGRELGEAGIKEFVNIKTTVRKP